MDCPLPESSNRNYANYAAAKNIPAFLLRDCAILRELIVCECIFLF
jgi:hypothetical protein